MAVQQKPACPVPICLGCFPWVRYETWAPAGTGACGVLLWDVKLGVPQGLDPLVPGKHRQASAQHWMSRAGWGDFAVGRIAGRRGSSCRIWGLGGDGRAR